MNTNETTLKRIRPTLIVISILFLGIPVIALNYSEMDFSMLYNTALHPSSLALPFKKAVLAKPYALMYLLLYLCLIIIVLNNYVFSYNAMIDAQKTLQINQEKLQYIASHDTLTGLYNRREFSALLDRAMLNSQRYNDRFALFVIDIDNFKAINDTFGHTQGDLLLKRFSEQLNTLTRKDEVLSRIGGDEFALIAFRLQSPMSAQKLCTRMIDALNRPYLAEGEWITTTASIGISIYPDDGETAEELLKNADIAMYRAKKEGKNTYQFYNKSKITIPTV